MRKTCLDEYLLTVRPFAITFIFFLRYYMDLLILHLVIFLKKSMGVYHFPLEPMLTYVRMSTCPHASEQYARLETEPWPPIYPLRVRIGVWLIVMTHFLYIPFLFSFNHA